MKPRVVKADVLKEYLTPEGCFIFENWGLSGNDKNVSIARARVAPGVITKKHHLDGVQEIYLIKEGKGKVHIGKLKPVNVIEGDIVVIPEGTSQRVCNIGKTDLIFYCICTPAFTADCYQVEEA
jgi:mannose-6-phosphate isomerase-like protein (cupin superfamily)